MMVTKAFLSDPKPGARYKGVWPGHDSIIMPVRAEQEAARILAETEREQPKTYHAPLSGYRCEDTGCGGLHRLLAESLTRAIESGVFDAV